MVYNNVSCLLINKQTNKMKEFVICSAIYYNDNIEHHIDVNIKTGFVVCGRRHSDCRMLLKTLNKPLFDNIDNDHTCGFMTNTNRFVNRKEAYTIAYNADQIIGPNKGYKFNDIGLTSEDLFGCDDYE